MQGAISSGLQKSVFFGTFLFFSRKTISVAICQSSVFFFSLFVAILKIFLC